MRITRFDTAPEYHPPLHSGVECRRLQGHEAGPTENFWVGLSIYAPGGAADDAAATEETVYTVLDGQLTIRQGTAAHVLGRFDSVHLAKGEVRSIVNAGRTPATLLVAIATPKD
jgi:uncharacterized cupin superfamily protein